MNPLDLQQQWDELMGKLLHVLIDWSNGLSASAAGGVQTLTGPVIGMLQSTDSFILHTPLNLVNALSDTLGTTQIMPLLHALVGTSLLFAAVAYAGHSFFGWGNLPDSLQRIGVTIVLVGISAQLLDWSLVMVEAISRGIIASIPGIPDLTGTNAVVIAFMMLFWALLLFNLALACGKRIAWMALLKATAPLAFMTFLHHKSSWIGSMFARMWVGWLISQVLVCLAMALCVSLVRIGGFGGYVLSCACLIVAYEAVYMFVPKGIGPLVSVGPIKIG